MNCVVGDIRFNVQVDMRTPAITDTFLYFVYSFIHCIHSFTPIVYVEINLQRAKLLNNC